MYGMELSGKVRAYQETGAGWERLNEQVSLFIYQWGLNKRNLGEDGAADFLLSFLPRIRSLVRNYSCYECPFEHYLKVCLEWHMIKFHAERDKAAKKEELYWQTAGRIDFLEFREKTPPYGSAAKESPAEFPQLFNDGRFKMRFLEYLLYNVDSINYRLIDNYADYLDMEKEELHGLLKKADNLISGKKEKREAIMEKKRTYFIEHKYHEMKLRITEDRKKREEILERMAVLNRKIENLMVRIDRIKMTPTTEQVGRMTGHSSSTVGRDLKIVREYLASLSGDQL